MVSYVNIGLDESTVESMVKAFSHNTDPVINEVREEYGWDTGNYKNGGSWDTRFNRIKLSALQNDLVVLQRKRGIWNFIVVLDIEDGQLFIFSKEKNFDIVKKKFGENSIHYFHALVSLNSKPRNLDNQQLELFSTTTDEYEARRLEEVQKILGEEYPLVKEVIFVIGEEENHRFVKVEARLYTRFFELVDKEDWTAYIADEQYEDVLELNESGNDDTEEFVIPKVKKAIKNRKGHGGTIPAKKDKEQTSEK